MLQIEDLLISHHNIDIGKDGKEIYETFDDGKIKTRLSGTDLKELKKKADFSMIALFCMKLIAGSEREDETFKLKVGRIHGCTVWGFRACIFPMQSPVK